jgi:hypothetical protein
MIGFRREVDILPQYELSQKHTEFTQKLQGRLFVSGISGSLTKHFEQTENKRRTNAVEIAISKNTEIKFRRDETKLKQLAKEWELMNKQRILRYKSAIIIQRKVRKHLQERRISSTTILTKFLQFVFQKSAVFVGGWALRTIKQFLLTVSLTIFSYKPDVK